MRYGAKGRDLEIIKEILKSYPYSFYVYGSRTKGNQQKFSDINLFIIDETQPASLPAQLKGEFEESDLSITIDVNSWFDIQEDFRCLVEKDLTIFHANPDFIKAETNQFSKCTYLPRALGYSVIDNGFASVTNCNLNTSMFNVTCRAKFDDQVGTRIQEIVDQYNNKPFAWWIGLMDIPADLGSELEKYGFRRQETDYVMFYKFVDFQPFELNKNITIEQVNTRKQIDEFLITLSSYDEYVRDFFNDRIISSEVMERNPLFVSYIDGKPVGNGSLHFTDNIVGIYDIITADNLRGHGIGTNMMKYLMNFTYQKGYNEICLSTSSDYGFRIYSKLGFKAVGIYGYYEWPGNQRDMK
jgi:ribosomal protein S18 acetylase RimI-like enzyme/predicted nucleotidyltransferase